MVLWEFIIIKNGGPLFMVLWGVPFLVFGFHLFIGRFFLDGWIRAGTVYGVTSERIIIIIAGVFSTEMKSLPLRTLRDVCITERPDGSGTIAFGQPDPRTSWFSGAWPATGVHSTPAFELIDGALEVCSIIKQAQIRLSALPKLFSTQA